MWCTHHVFAARDRPPGAAHQSSGLSAYPTAGPTTAHTVDLGDAATIPRYVSPGRALMAARRARAPGGALCHATPPPSLPPGGSTPARRHVALAEKPPPCHPPPSLRAHRVSSHHTSLKHATSTRRAAATCGCFTWWSRPSAVAAQSGSPASCAPADYRVELSAFSRCAPRLPRRMKRVGAARVALAHWGACLTAVCVDQGLRPLLAAVGGAVGAARRPCRRCLWPARSSGWPGHSRSSAWLPCCSSTRSVQRAMSAAMATARALAACWAGLLLWRGLAV